MDKTPLRIGIIGYGGMGEWHAETLKNIPECMLYGIYDIAPRRQSAAARNGLRSYDSLEELLADSNIDAVTVATPNDTHIDISLKAMNAGKHVVCEKPVALSSSELAQMTECADKNGVLFTVHQNRRWDEDFLVVKKLFEEKTLGPVFNIESRVHGSRGIPGDWRNKKEYGGGMVLDWGVHIIDQILFMLPDRKLKSVWAQLSHITNEEVDDGFHVFLQFDDNLTCLLEVGTSNFINLPRWYVQGENGTAVISDWELNGEIVMVSDWEKRDAVPVVTAAGLTKTMAPRTDETIRRYPLPEVKSDIRDYYRNFAAAVNDGEELLVRPDEVMRVMRVMEAVFESARRNETVVFED